MTSVTVLLAGGVSIYLSRNLILSNFRRIVQFAWSPDSFTHPGIFATSGFFINILLSLLLMMAPVVLSILLSAVIVNLIQLKGFFLSFQILKFDLGRLNPIGGIKGLFSLMAFVELFKSIVKLTIVFSVAYSVLWPQKDAIARLALGDTQDFLSFTGMLALKLLYRVVGYMFIVSMLDVYYQKWQHKHNLRMTKQEVKEEAKQAEGNPQVKSKIRSIQRSLARQRMLGKVKKATVIITNPTHFAVALRYEQGMQAPEVIAKGVDFLALKIIDLGRKHGVSIVQNPPLARALYKQVRLDETIPIELYRAVAKILAFIYQQKQRKQNG